MCAAVARRLLYSRSLAVNSCRLQSSAERSEQLRSEFTLPASYDYRTWFPMHMSVQLKKMEGKLRSVDLIVEVHDARIPISGRNPQFFTQLYAVRPHILVMNKVDLIDVKKYRIPVEDYYRDHGINRIIWTNCKRKQSKSIDELKDAIINELTANPRFNRTVKSEYQIMVVGIPNVGKSSLINALRTNNLGIKHCAVVEGARPGVTVRVQNRVRILDKPPVYIVDTPGVLPPRLGSLEDAMKLALCDLILESATSPKHVADYLLYWMNRTGDQSYLSRLGLSGEATDEIEKLLLRICSQLDMRVTRLIGSEGYQERWDTDKAAKMIISLFRTRKLKDHCLDKELLFRYL